MALNSNVMRDPSSTLDQLLKRKLAAVACATNGCAYCTAHSCSMLKKTRGDDFEGWGLSEQELQDIITGAPSRRTNLSAFASIMCARRRRIQPRFPTRSCNV